MQYTIYARLSLRFNACMALKRKLGAHVPFRAVKLSASRDLGYKELNKHKACVQAPKQETCEYLHNAGSLLRIV